MYRLYQNAVVCYVYLKDFDSRLANLETDLSGCRWFTRGWCLQELIAPQAMEFLDAHWSCIGSKKSLSRLISEITRIDQEVLADGSLIGSIPVARRMSWAAKRQTTREEDMAYCLLGIFDVNMTMLYGEGAKAFIRLQMEIIKDINDLSIFAFPQKDTGLGSGVSRGPAHPYRAVFATSPGDFIGCGDLTFARIDGRWNSSFSLTNKVLYFQAAELKVDSLKGLYSVPLDCESANSDRPRMHLRKVGPGLYARVDNNDLDGFQGQDIRIEEDLHIIKQITPSIQYQLEDADINAIHVRSRTDSLSKALQVFQRAPASARWDVSRMMFLTRGEKPFRGYWKLFPSLATKIGPNSPPGHIYVVCGLDYPQHSPTPRAWLRLLSLEEWRDLEKRFGIISNQDDVSPFRDSNHTSGQITLGSSSTGLILITAALNPQLNEGKPSFELIIDLEKTPNN